MTNGPIYSLKRDKSKSKHMDRTIEVESSIWKVIKSGEK